MKEKKRDRLETLEWLAEFVMACPEGSIAVHRQQRLIRELDGAETRRASHETNR